MEDLKKIIEQDKLNLKKEEEFRKQYPYGSEVEAAADAIASARYKLESDNVPISDQEFEMIQSALGVIESIAEELNDIATKANKAYHGNNE